MKRISKILINHSKDDNVEKLIDSYAKLSSNNFQVLNTYFQKSLKKCDYCVEKNLSSNRASATKFKNTIRRKKSNCFESKFTPKSLTGSTKIVTTFIKSSDYCERFIISSHPKLLFQKIEFWNIIIKTDIQAVVQILEHDPDSDYEFTLFPFECEYFKISIDFYVSHKYYSIFNLSIWPKKLQFSPIRIKIFQFSYYQNPFKNNSFNIFICHIIPQIALWLKGNGLGGPILVTSKDNKFLTGATVLTIGILMSQKVLNINVRKAILKLKKQNCQLLNTFEEYKQVYETIINVVFLMKKSYFPEQFLNFYYFENSFKKALKTYIITIEKHLLYNATQKSSNDIETTFNYIFNKSICKVLCLNQKKSLKIKDYLESFLERLERDKSKNYNLVFLYSSKSVSRRKYLSDMNISNLNEKPLIKKRAYTCNSQLSTSISFTEQNYDRVENKKQVLVPKLQFSEDSLLSTKENIISDDNIQRLCQSTCTNLSTATFKDFENLNIECQQSNDINENKKKKKNPFYLKRNSLNLKNPDNNQFNNTIREFTNESNIENDAEIIISFDKVSTEEFKDVNKRLIMAGRKEKIKLTKSMYNLLESSTHIIDLSVGSRLSHIIYENYMKHNEKLKLIGLDEPLYIQDLLHVVKLSKLFKNGRINDQVYIDVKIDNNFSINKISQNICNFYNNQNNNSSIESIIINMDSDSNLINFLACNIVIDSFHHITRADPFFCLNYVFDQLKISKSYTKDNLNDYYKIINRICKSLEEKYNQKTKIMINEKMNLYY